ncbi:MAG TPA: LppX_LprAFG lipoprotein [Actinomycetes bacterium]|nr:LppX_LprAFG lipoprotein [Actinomycetes bacterium]
MASRTRVRAGLAGMVAALWLVAGCSGGEDNAPADELTAAGALAAAQERFDSATSAHFVLTSADLPPGRAALVGGEGVAARPPAFQGDLDVLLGGGTVTVSVISVGGTVYAKLPFATGYQETDPSAFGISDPATFLDPERGLSRLFTEMTDPKLAGQSRIAGDVVQKVTGKVPGEVVDEVLTTADPSAPVDVTLSLVDGTSELRRAVLTGPFFAADTQSTYTVVLDRYGEDVQIDAPPTG